MENKLNKINDILNVTTEIKTPDGVSFIGQFVKPESNIWFVGRVKFDDFSFMSNKNEFSLSGTVSGINIYIKTGIITKTSITNNKPKYVDVHILPFELMIGKEVNNNTKVERIEVEFSELNCFLGSGLEVNSSALNESKFDCKMMPLDFFPVTYDENKHLIFQRNISSQITLSDLNLMNVNKVIILFDSLIDVDNAIHELAKIRLLLSFLADDFIDYPESFSFVAQDSQRLENSDCKLADKIIWLNDNRIQYPQKWKHPFRILYHTINHDFPDILKKWNAFYSEKSNQPIIKLFVEIISHKSIGLNRFLNICQALEVYSTHYRTEECKTLLNKMTDKRITLRLRLFDLLTLQNDVFEYQKSYIAESSKDIADIRNYYTHYNSSKLKILEDKFGEMGLFYNQYNEILYSLLLATIYKEIGIPREVIKKSIKNLSMRFGKTLEYYFEGPD